MTNTEVTRLREKASVDRHALDQLLDSTLIGHFALTDAAGRPRIIPTAVVRDGDRVLVHGSTGSVWMRELEKGVATCLAVTAFDGLVIARSAFESSIHYRSAVLFGHCSEVEGTGKLRALDLITEALVPGRVAELRKPSDRELAATLVLSMPIQQWSLKISAGWPDDPAEDVAADAWAGVLPRTAGYGPPTGAPDLRAGVPVPPSVLGLLALWSSEPGMTAPRASAPRDSSAAP